MAKPILVLRDSDHADGRSYLAMYSLIWATDSSKAGSSKILKHRQIISTV